MFLESICIINGDVQNIEAHQKRMNETASYYRFTAPELPDLRNLLSDGLKETKVKCRICYHNRIESISFEKYIKREIHSLKLVAASPDYAFKFAGRTVLKDLLQFRDGCDDIIIVRNNLITDTSYSNLVFKKGEDLFTPDYPLLNGTKRQKLINEGVIKESEINADAIGEYDRVWLINALLDIEDNVSLPVENISS